MKALIIDDEKKARQVLEILIQENCPEISEIFKAEDLLSGVEIIKKEKPGLVFLDIEMPEHSGLEILNFIEKDTYNFEIVFITAYRDYAIQAFRLSAIDYLLKPVSISQVKSAVAKALSFFGRTEIRQRLQELKHSLEDSNFKKIGLHNTDGIKFVNFSDIIMFEANGMYTNVTTENQGVILVSKPLKHFVETLKNVKIFYKPHRSFLINVRHVKEYIKKDGGYIIMVNNQSVSISNEKKQQFLTLINQI